ncbi:polymeric immunoglobulin receptor-like isoform X2 [Narcine bancroftii]|uniref:polymeric immunoglobulin receptor-like isoform X2 n=1 Tax=Narcine bancroftii TaxID=1343680 RepID=UPI003831CB56
MEVGWAQFTHQKRSSYKVTIALLLLISVDLSSGSTAITGPKQVKGEEGQSVTMECRYNRKYRDYKKQWCSTAITGPKHVKGEEGQSVTVECRYDRKYRDYKKQWCSGYYNLSSAVVVSTDRPQNGRSSMTDNKAEAIMSVTIDNLQKEDEGLYWCVIEKIIDEKFLIHLQVSEGLTAITGPEHVKGEEGQSVTIECRYDQKYRDYKKQWCSGYYNLSSAVVVSTDRLQNGRSSMTDNKAEAIMSVTIDNLQKEDEGFYWCVIEKIMNEKFLIHLQVSEGSIAITGPKHVKGEEGQSITMECRYDRKYRDYKKQWCSGYLYLSRAVVVSSDRPQHGRSSMTDNKTEAIMSFTIDNLQKEDEGWYWCVIEKMINEKISFYLQVSEDSSSIVTSGPSTFSMKTAGAETSTAALQTSSSPQTWNQHSFPYPTVLSVVLSVFFLLFIAATITCIKIKWQKKKNDTNRKRNEENLSGSSTEIPIVYTTINFCPKDNVENTYMNLQSLNVQEARSQNDSENVTYSAVAHKSQ